MARSRKKVPGFSDSEGRKRKAKFLRLMNRRIRRLGGQEDNYWVPNGNRYRLFVGRWNFRDYSFRFYSKRELKESWYGPDRLYQPVRK